MPHTPTLPPLPISSAVALAISGYAEFELDLERAIRENLPVVLDSVAPAALTKSNVTLLPERVQGVYMLLENNVPTYIGKTDAEHGFRDRLARHFSTLSARLNLDLSTISFKAVRIMVFTVMSVESTLIDVYTKGNPESWQNTGFGSNDPGHNRENQEPSQFDKGRPVNIDIPVDGLPVGVSTARDFMVILKNSLPFDFRYETDIGPKGKPVKYTVGHVDQRNTMINVPRSGMTVREILTDVLLSALPDGWTVTIFPGRIILYKAPDSYRYALGQIKRPALVPVLAPPVP